MSHAALPSAVIRSLAVRETREHHLYRQRLVCAPGNIYPAAPRSIAAQISCGCPSPEITTTGVSGSSCFIRRNASKPLTPRHGQIDEHEVDLQFRRPLERLIEVVGAGRLDLGVELEQQRLHAFDVERVIVDD